jgi:hypothetical protein
VFRKVLFGSLVALVGAIVVPTAASAEEVLDFSRFKAPACEASGGTCAESDAVAGDSLTDFLSDPSTQEPIDLQADTWTEYRWVYNGCCLNKTRYKQQRRTCSCCYVTPPAVRCGSWTDTGTSKCEGNCIM